MLNPANGQTIGHVADMTTADAENAITVAHQAFQTWRHKTGKVRPYIYSSTYTGILRMYEYFKMMLCQRSQRHCFVIVQERSVLLRKWYELIVQNSDELARVLTTEMVR